MCQQCPEWANHITKDHGVVVVSMGVDKNERKIVYDILLDGVEMEIRMPLSTSMVGPLECATFIGQHLQEIISDCSQAYLSADMSRTTEVGIEGLEEMLRRQTPDS
jgi:hypothetical protein